MATSIVKRFKNGWNAFLGRDPTLNTDVLTNFVHEGYHYSTRPDRFHARYTSAKAIVAKVYNRIALDIAMLDFVHARVDGEGNFVEIIDDGLNEVLTLSANIDQTGRAFRQDAVQSLFDEGTVALVPIDTDNDPTNDSDMYDIHSMRVGRIVEWMNYYVKIEAYNEDIGKKSNLIMPKKAVAIVENPFYAVMNETNSTLQDLLRTIRKLDAYNDQNANGKLDLIIQLPYVIKSEQRRREAEQRRNDLEEQLTGSSLGIGYIDGTEKVVQLNRSLENNLWTQVQDLTTKLYNELGLSQAIIDGTASEQEIVNYYDRTISPTATAFSEEMTRKFLSPTARSQGQRILFFRDPFKLVPVAKLADIADKFRRNEIMTSNEFRGKIGLKPSSDSNADSIRNPNLNKSNKDYEAEGLEGVQNGTEDSANEDLVTKLLSKGGK